MHTPQATITDHEAVFTIYGSPRGGKMDYKEEAAEVLNRLTEQLDAAATLLPKGMNKQMLKRVSVLAAVSRYWRKRVSLCCSVSRMKARRWGLTRKFFLGI
jgi:hypothetical protein